MYCKKEQEKGLSILEDVVSTFFIVVVLTALIGLGTSSITRSTASKSRVVAFGLLEEGIEAVRMIRDNRVNFSGASDNIWGVQDDSGTWGGWDWENADFDNHQYYVLLPAATNTGWKIDHKANADCSGNAANSADVCYRLATPIDNIEFYRQVKIYNTDILLDNSRTVVITIGWYERGDFKTSSASTILTAWDF